MALGEKKKVNKAHTKVMVCTFHWRTNIGYLGTVIKVMAVHGHYMTMKKQLKREDYNEWWDKIYDMIQQHDVNFLVGDFNMSLTQVVPQLRKRGLQIDTISWYPWLHLEENCLGMDSMAIFYIGGDMISKMPWNIDNIGELLKAASAVPRPQLRQSGEGRKRLDTYTGKRFPGQMLTSYRGPAWKNTEPPQKLEEKLTDLLTPSTGHARLQHLRAHRRDPLVPFCFRTLQKTLDGRQWLVGPDGVVRKGAHFPQVMFTDNSCGRSKEAFERRRQSHPIQNAWWAKGATHGWQRGSELTGKTAVAASGKGGKDGRRNEGGKGGKGQTAVAAGEYWQERAELSEIHLQDALAAGEAAFERAAAGARAARAAAASESGADAPAASAESGASAPAAAAESGSHSDSSLESIQAIQAILRSAKIRRRFLGECGASGDSSDTGECGASGTSPQ